VRIPYEAKNALEKEIETYEQVIFPPRPVEMEEVHEQRLEESKKKRKEKRTRKLEEGAALVIH
jgi:hypothetical protein